MTGRARPVRRRRVLLGVLIAAGLVAGIVLLTENLRHPHPAGDPVTMEGPEDPDADPRTEVICEEPLPHEGAPRQGTGGPRGEARSVTSNDLYDCPETWDGRQVRYEGEAIGGVLARGDIAWVQLNDDVYADARGPLPAHRDYRGGNAGIGVAIPSELAAEITTVGGPRAQGDLVEVVGTFHRVDSSSREVAVIRADDAAVVRPGEQLTPARLPDREIAAAILGVLALVIVGFERRRAWQRRSH